MPLAFESQSHGTIAFGFFQIESHMLLLDRLFFFAHDFCRSVEQVAGSDRGSMQGWRIADLQDIGNLHGAIAGRDLSGLIGATYERWPFPEAPEDFKQDPGGHVNRGAAREMIQRFGAEEAIDLVRDEKDRISIGDYAFDRPGFAALVAYVDRGGYPRWRGEVRPDYVTRMLEADAVLSLLR